MAFSMNVDKSEMRMRDCGVGSGAGIFYCWVNWVKMRREERMSDTLSRSGC